jgi:hypothetical protein
MRLHLWRPLAFAVAASLAIAVSTLAAEKAAADKSAADLLPASIVGYAEVPQPNRVLDTVLGHPLAKRIEQAPEYQAALRTPQYEQYQAVLKHVEEQLGLPWREAASKLTSGGLFVGFDLASQGVVVLSQGADEQCAAKARDTAIALVRAEATRQGQPDPIKQEERRGVAVYQIGDVCFAAFGRWLVVANKPILVSMVLENQFTDGDTLADDKQFQTVLAAREADPAAWLYVDLRVLRLTGALKKALDKKSDNPAAELLVGGILGAIPDAPYVTASLQISNSRLSVAAALPCDPQAIAKSREFYVGADGNGVAPPLLKPRGTLLSLSTYRDFGSLWRHAPDLFDEGINAKFAEAESGLNTLFAGRDFGDEILGNLVPGLQLVVARQEFPQGGITPQIKLPAGAIVVRMKKPEETARLFKITFQSAVGFLNVAGAQNGLSPLDVNSEKTDAGLIVSGEYLPPIDETKRTDAALQYNASPTIAVVGDKFILASSKPLALELAANLQENALATPANTALVVDGPGVQAALAENRDPLIAQNMLQKGHDRPAAEAEIDRALDVLKLLERAALSLSMAEGRAKLTVDVDLADAK